MKFFINIFKGILIGSGAILPGISSGVMCVILGIYENILERILHFFKNPKENIQFFLPYILGGAIGIFLIGKLLLFLFNTYYTATCLAFSGLILGCIPSIIKQSDKITHDKFVHWLLFFLTLALSIYLVALESINSINYTSTPSALNLIISGIFMSAGVVIPGVSKSVILMIMGIYETYLAAIANINLAILFPMGIGLLIGGYIFLKVINFLFQNFKTYTYYAIAGFSLGSIFVILPPFVLNAEYVIGTLLFILCIFVSYFLSSLDVN